MEYVGCTLSLLVILEAQAFKTMVLFGTRFANSSISREDWKEVYGFLLGYKENEDTLNIQSMVPFIHGSATEVRFSEEDYGLAEEVVDKAENAGQFLVGWFHTHPGLGLYLSDIDILNHLGFQSVNPLAVAVVLDPALVAEMGYGFKVFALDNPDEGPAANPLEREFKIQGLDPTFLAATLLRVVQDAAFQRPLAPEFKEISQLAGEPEKTEFINEYFPPSPIPKPPPSLDSTLIPQSNISDLENWIEPKPLLADITARGGICSEIDCVPSAE
ncbi:MAG: 26S proteasome regulatory subunit N11, partial [Promethearchaeota archaeon CR_4]